MVRQPDGTIVLLDAAGTTPIGVAGRRGGRRRGRPVPGSIVVAYTDGLVERRDETIDVGIERLAPGSPRAPDAPTSKQIADALIEQCLGDPPTDDDTALLVVRVETT